MNRLFEKVKEFERKNKLNQKFDQNFLIEEEVINDFINFCHIKKNEKIIEVGSGLGFLTEKLGFLANKIFSFEIDERFKSFLTKLPNNVEIIFGDAYKLFCNKDFILV